MRKLFTLCLLVFSLSASAQWQQTGSKVRYVNGLGIPTKDTAAGVAADSSQILIRPADSALYVKYKRTWLRVGGGGGSIAGSGTTNYIPKFTSSSAIGNSQIFDNGTNVGIGTTSISARLTVRGAGLTSATASFEAANSSGNTRFYVQDDGTTRFFGGSLTETMRVNTDGNVGIGTASPAYPLQVRRAGGAGSLGISIDAVGNTDRAVQYFSIQDNASGVGAGHAFYYRTPSSTTDVLGYILDEAGNVGISTTSPDARLRVAGTYNGTQAIFGFTDGRGLLIGTASNGTNEAVSILNARGSGAGMLQFQTDGTDRVRIGNSGNVMINTTTDNGTDRLQVSGSARTSSNLQVDGLIGINITPASYSLNINSGGTNVTRIATQQTNNINNYEHSSSTSFGRIGNASAFNASGSTGDMSVGSFNNLSFYTFSGSFIERARITATSGNLLISTTTDNNTDKLQVNGSIQGTGFNQAYTARTTTYTAATSDYFIDCTSGTFTVNLFTAVGNTGRILIIKNSGTGTITVDPNGTQTIDGATTQTLSTQWSKVHIISDGANWKIISN